MLTQNFFKTIIVRQFCCQFREYFVLGEKLDDSVIVKKIVRVLPDRFNVKLTTMEEANDFSTMKVEELMGSLRTFELNQKIR